MIWRRKGKYVANDCFIYLSILNLYLKYGPGRPRTHGIDRGGCILCTSGGVPTHIYDGLYCVLIICRGFWIFFAGSGRDI